MKSFKKEITIKDTIKEILHNNFKGTLNSRFKEYKLNREVINDEYTVYTYTVNDKYDIRIHHNTALKEIEFRLRNNFNLIQQINIQYL